MKDEHTNFYHPPLLPMPDVPIPNHYGAYLQKRKHSVHTGVDLYADEGQPVYAVEDGEVVIVKWFTGEICGSPWWNDTEALYVKGYTGTICYGEVEPVRENMEGKDVKCGEVIARVKRVLKEDKGKAMSMLHFALHRHGLDLQIKNNEDPNSDDFYDLQIDPTMLLVQLKAKADIMMLSNGSCDGCMSAGNEYDKTCEFCNRKLNQLRDRFLMKDRFLKED